MKQLTKTEAELLFAKRGFEEDLSEIRSRVYDIIAEVKAHGDAALIEFTKRFDNVALRSLKVSEAEFLEADEKVDSETKAAIALAIERVSNFHVKQPAGGFLEAFDGAMMGQLVVPMQRIACYIPAGQAPLFSTIVMTAVPAQVAGVEDIAIFSPCKADGSVAPEILYTAKLLGITEVIKVGGAQAIAAAAYGTESIQKVDKVVGPGNIYVVLAKQALFGVVGIESLPGPTETLVLADDSAHVSHVVADLLAQAEHDGAQPVFVTTSKRLMNELDSELELQLSTLSTEKEARESLSQRGIAVLVDTIEEGIDLANTYAPEHLCLLVEEPWQYIPKVKNAGIIFAGENSMEALGDYVAGPSHVMPTGGSARFMSGVNVRDFQKVIPVVSMDAETVQKIGPAGARMARAEGLEAHARAIESRLKKAKLNKSMKN